MPIPKPRTWFVGHHHLPEINPPCYTKTRKVCCVCQSSMWQRSLDAINAASTSGRKHRLWICRRPLGSSSVVLYETAFESLSASRLSATWVTSVTGDELRVRTLQSQSDSPRGSTMLKGRQHWKWERVCYLHKILWRVLVPTINR